MSRPSPACAGTCRRSWTRWDRGGRRPLAPRGNPARCGPGGPGNHRASFQEPRSPRSPASGLVLMILDGRRAIPIAAFFRSRPGPSSEKVCFRIFSPPSSTKNRGAKTAADRGTPGLGWIRTAGSQGGRTAAVRAGGEGFCGSASVRSRHRFPGPGKP